MSIKPALVTWSRGQILPETANKLEFKIVKGEEKSSSGKLVASYSNKCSFYGKLDQSSYHKNILVIRNKKTNTVKFLTVRFYDTNHYLMLPYDINEKINQEKRENISNKDAILNLNKVMGSKKSKNRVKEIEKSNVTLGNIEKNLKNAIKNKDKNINFSDDTQTSTVKESFLIPPCNRNASTIEQVYNLYEIMSNEVLISLDDVTSTIIKNNKSARVPGSLRSSQFFSTVLSSIKSFNSNKIKMLLFADALLKFLHIVGNQLRKKQIIICEYSETLNNKILDDFTFLGLNGSRQRSSTLRDKAICYILVLLFLIYDYVVDINVFSGNISTKDYQRLRILMKAVGAKPEKKSSTIFSLKLPLAQISNENHSHLKSNKLKKLR